MPVARPFTGSSYPRILGTGSTVGARPLVSDPAVVLGLPRDTDIAKFSLDPGVTPEVRTDHALVIRARVIDSRRGTIQANLAESGTPTGTTLETAQLTSSFATYILPFPDSEAAAITDYTALEVWIWGHSVIGDPVSFEVADVWLSTPQGAVINMPSWTTNAFPSY